MSTTHYDYMIVGNGLAGSVLSAMLIDRGKSVLVIDRYNPYSSSQVAAGLVNPITGRRVVKSWMADELIPFADAFYSRIEAKSNSTFYHKKDVLEVIHNTKDLNDWLSRTEEAGLKKYLLSNGPDDLYAGKITGFKKLIRITLSGWMNIPGFIKSNRQVLTDSYNLIESEMKFSELKISRDKINYDKFTCRRIIFCEGYRSAVNPLWENVPFLPAKGEILLIECRQLPEEYILMSGFFLIPVGEHRFRVGSTYEWNFTDELPTEAGKQKLRNLLINFLKIPFEIVEHTAGIRPTLKDRRPVIGRHGHYDHVFIFNGLGTKGVILAPYFADHFVNVLEGDSKLMDEVDVKRFDI